MRDVEGTTMNFKTLVKLVKDAWKGLLRNASFMSLIIVTACMFILGISMLFVVNLNNIGDELAEQVGIRVFIKGDADSKAKEGLERAIRALPDVNDVVYIDREQALKDFLKDNPDYNSALDLLPGNPLPDSYDVELEDFTKVREVAVAIEGMDAVDSLSYGQGYVDNLMGFMRVVWLVTGGLSLVAVFVISMIIGNTIKMTVYSRRKEIEIMKLVGATDRYIQFPFVIEGVTLGFLGSVLATVVLFLGYKYVVVWVSRAAAFVPMVVDNLTLVGIGLCMILVGSVVGALSSLLSTMRHLKI